MHQGGSRRDFLGWLAATGGGVLLAGHPWAGRAFAHTASGKAGATVSPVEVTPTEDLMREHGILQRLLLICEECGRRLLSGTGYDPAPLQDALGLVRRFIEDYHEKLEEDHVFPLFEGAGKLTDLVGVLRQQHQAGRRLTATILDLSKRAASESAAKQQLAMAIVAFSRVYRPHAAREDTVLFPALRSIMTPKAFAELGEMFEDSEHQLFGKAGFEGIVEQVASIERTLGIYDLSQFTP